MNFIVCYLKNVNPITTESLAAPEGSTELCTLPDGFTYVSIPAGAAIDSEQHQSVLDTLDYPEMTEELIEQISMSSTHIQLINSRVRDKIAEQYSVYDEIKLMRTAPSREFDVYNEHVEACRLWGREQKALLGL